MFSLCLLFSGYATNNIVTFKWCVFLVIAKVNSWLTTKNSCPNVESSTQKYATVPLRIFWNVLFIIPKFTLCILCALHTGHFQNKQFEILRFYGQIQNVLNVRS